MSLVVEFQIDGPAIKLTEVAATLEDVTLEVERWRRNGGLIKLFVWASGEDLHRVSQAFHTLSHVQDVSVVNDGQSVRLYGISLSPTIEMPPEETLGNSTVTEWHIRPNGLHLTSRVESRETLTNIWNYLRARDIEITIKELRRARQTDNDSRLSDAQLEALATAHEMGYFEESTTVTQAEIAATLDISQAAFSERLRRAQQQLVEQQLNPSP